MFFSLTVYHLFFSTRLSATRFLQSALWCAVQRRGQYVISSTLWFLLAKSTPSQLNVGRDQHAETGNGRVTQMPFRFCARVENDLMGLAHQGIEECGISRGVLGYRPRLQISQTPMQDNPMDALEVAVGRL